jgi:hypothetical protein
MVEDNENGCVIQNRRHFLVDKSDNNIVPFRYICKNEVYDKGFKNCLFILEKIKVNESKLLLFENVTNKKFLEPCFRRSRHLNRSGELNCELRAFKAEQLYNRTISQTSMGPAKSFARNTCNLDFPAPNWMEKKRFL